MRHVWLLAGAAALAACAGGIRPSYTPLPAARTDTLTAMPAEIVQAIVTGLTTEALRVQWQSEAEGYVETQWHDLVSRENGSYNRAQPERFVRLRFFVDPVGADRSSVVSEAVILRTTDPSVMEREAEMMAPPGHAGQQLLDRVLEHIRSALGT